MACKNVHFRAFLHATFIRYFIELQPFGHFLTAPQGATGVQLPLAFCLWITLRVRVIRHDIPSTRTPERYAASIRHAIQTFHRYSARFPLP